LPSSTDLYLALGTPIGSSTLFGFSFQLQDAWPSAIRLWWHFAMNLAATTAALAGLLELHRAGLLRLSWGRTIVFDRPRDITETG
jgi:hypothetical protein